MVARILKWIGFVIGGLIVLVLIVAGIAILGTNQKLNKTYQPPNDQLTIPTDAAAVARGKQWVTTICAGCHGSDLSGGNVLFDAPPLGHIESANLTPGKGGAGSTFTDADWIRAIRYGVDPEGKSVFVMPSYAFTYFSDQDLVDIIAYLKTLPPVDKEVPEPEFRPLGRILIGLGVLNLPVSASLIPADVNRPASMPPSTSAEYGAYLVKVSDCQTCHGQQLSGGKDPDPAAPPAPNLTPAGVLGHWDEAGFISAIRTGVTPDNLHLQDFMPWKDFRNYSDDDLKAIWAYLHSLPALPTTTQ